MTERKLTKVVITGYLDLDEDERDFILESLDRITYRMVAGAGIMTNVEEEIVSATKLEEFPDEVQDFFQYMFEEDE